MPAARTSETMIITVVMSKDVFDEIDNPLEDPNRRLFVWDLAGLNALLEEGGADNGCEVQLGDLGFNLLVCANKVAPRGCYHGVLVVLLAEKDDGVPVKEEGLA